MGALGGVPGGLWWNFSSQNPPPPHSHRRPSSPSDSGETTASGGGGFRFPFKQAATAGSLALTGDAIAQFRERWRKKKSEANRNDSVSEAGDLSKDVAWALTMDHDWLRALRMTSYGFLFYGPGSYLWYQLLDSHMPKPTVQNLLSKVLLNQIILGPCVIAVVFAWNNLWQRKLSELPDKYRKDALPTLLQGFKFWIPVSALNFWVIPLQARVAFMSSGSIFWNFYLSSTMNK